MKQVTVPILAHPAEQSVLQLGCRLREYCPVGELLPGMAYLVRRLLENTSNEGFLANRFAKGASRDQLLKNPAALAATAADPLRQSASAASQSAVSSWAKEGKGKPWRMKSEG